MSSESNKKLFYIGGVVALIVLVYVIYIFFFTCKSGQIKIGGKCHPVVKQNTPTRDGGVESDDKLGMLIDGLYNTHANVLSNNVLFNLNINGGSKQLKGLKVVAAAKKDAAATSPAEVKLLQTATSTTPLATLKFNQDDKKYSKEATFTPVSASQVILSIPANMMVYEVQLV